MFKNEALRLKKEGWGCLMIAKALVFPRSTVHSWLHRSPEAHRESNRQWRREHKEELRERRQKEKEEAREDLMKEHGGRCQRCGETIDDPDIVDFHELEKVKEDRGKPFMRTRLGRSWRRYRKTKHRKEVLEVIRKKVMLFDTKCHRKITAKERRLGRRLSREEILKDTDQGIQSL